MEKEMESKVKGCVRYIFASLFFISKNTTCETRKNGFYFPLKALFVLKIFKCHDVIKWPSINHETHFIEQLKK